ncbi:MAG: BamA/TamA family outer membrane protein [Deltaproteobacteria bacterium]|nr:BamA/TamA family outer membrane protein [Deltaproteobacteria bacterium]
MAASFLLSTLVAAGFLAKAVVSPVGDRSAQAVAPPANPEAMQAVAPPAEDLLGRTIVEVAIEGAEPEEVGPIEGVEGAPLTRGLVRELIAALWATDLFRDVGVHALPVAGGVRLVVRLDVRRRIRAFEAEGNDRLDDDELRRAAGFVPDAEERPDLLDEMRGRIEAAYAVRGFPNAVVEFRSEETAESGRVTLIAEIAEGEPIRIASVRLAGVLVFPEPLLYDVLDVEAGDPWDQPELDEAAERLAAFYRREDYLLAWVPPPVATPHGETGAAVDVAFAIDPGLPVRIVFGGNEHVSSADLAVIAAFDDQSVFDRAELDEAVERLVAAYHQLGFPGARVTWDVVEGVPAEPAPAGPFSDPGAWAVGVRAADPFGPVCEGGLGDAAEPAPPSPVWFLRFRVDEGARLGVSRIEWVGVTAYDPEDLDDMVFENLEAAIERPSVFQPLPPGELGGLGLSGEDRLPAAAFPAFLLEWGPEDVYLERAYRDAAVRVEERYRSDGYLDARVTPLGPLTDPEAGTIRPRFEVAEGVQSILAGIGIAGEEALGEEELRDAFLVEAGDAVNERLVEETRQAIIDLYGEHGYLFAQVEREVEFFEDRTRVALTFAVTEGPQVRVKSIEISGHSDTETSLVLGTLAFAEGDVFTPDAAQESERRLLRMGIFQSATVAMVAPDVVEPEKTIAVQVREYLPQSLELRAGFSTAEGARASLAYGYRNLFGYAIGFHLRLKINYQLFFLGNDTFEAEFRKLSLQDQLERLLVASLAVPYLPGLGGLLATQLDLANERDDEPFFGIDRSSAFLGLSSAWRTLLSYSLRVGVEYNDVARFQGDYPLCSSELPAGTVCMSPADARRLRTPQGVSTFSVVRGAFTVDWRDDPFNPTRGLYFAADAEWVRSFEPVFDAGTGTTSFSNLIKATFQLTGYAPLGAGLVLILSARYGQVFQLQDGSRTFPDRYFYLGGSDTLRGFPQESLSVADAPAGLPSAGGDVFLVLRSELRLPLGDTFGVAFFSDIGNVWREFANIDPGDLRYTVGLGFLINTPIGPLSFDYGFNILRREDWGESIGALHFSIGSF